MHMFGNTQSDAFENVILCQREYCIFWFKFVQKLTIFRQ